MHKIALAGLVFASLLASTSSDAAHKKMLKKASLVAAEAPKEHESGMRGIYVRGETAGHASFAGLLDRVAAHGMNSIVLDVKDYDG